MRKVKRLKFFADFQFNFIAPKERDFLEKSYDFSRRHSDTADLISRKEMKKQRGELKVKSLVLPLNLIL
jgi:hypothetical protein